MQKTIPIMHVVLSLRVGGLEKVVVDLLKSLPRDKYRSVLCCLGGERLVNGKDSLVNIAEGCGISVIVLNRKPKGIDYRLILRLAREMNKESVIIAHSHNLIPHLYTVLAARIARVPIVVHTRHGRNAPDKPKTVFLNRVLSCLSDVIVPVSDDASEVVTQIEKVPARKVITIANGISTEDYDVEVNDQRKKAEIGIFDSGPVIGIVASLTHAKDHSTLLDAFSIVLKAVKTAKLVIVGDGELKSILQAKAKKLAIHEKVLFLGIRQDVPELLSIFDLFVLSSVTEGLSLSLLEAMAAGLPIVATDVGGNSQAVSDGETGLLVPSRNPDELARAIIELLKDRRRAKEIGVRGKERVNRCFHLDKMVREYENLYQTLIRQRRPW